MKKSGKLSFWKRCAGKVATGRRVERAAQHFGRHRPPRLAGTGGPAQTAPRVPPWCPASLHVAPSLYGPTTPGAGGETENRVAAAKLVRDGQLLFVDGGTTTLQLACHLSEELRATVVTNSPPRSRSR